MLTKKNYYKKTVLVPLTTCWYILGHSICEWWLRLHDCHWNHICYHVTSEPRDYYSLLTTGRHTITEIAVKEEFLCGTLTTHHIIYALVFSYIGLKKAFRTMYM